MNNKKIELCPDCGGLHLTEEELDNFNRSGRRQRLATAALQGLLANERLTGELAAAQLAMDRSTANEEIGEEFILMGSACSKLTDMAYWLADAMETSSRTRPPMGLQWLISEMIHEEDDDDDDDDEEVVD